MNSPKVSIIVPIYKVEEEIAKCIESLLNQDYDDFEIILVDDGSPDNSGKIADHYANEYPNIIRTMHQENRGLSGARNTGMRLARGRYLSFVDSDDFLEPNTISYMVSELEKNDADIAVCGRYDDYPNRTVTNFTMEKISVLSAEEAIRRILTWNQMDISACDKLFKVELWEEIFFPEGENNEDIRIIPYVISKATRIVHVGLPLYHYCHRENSITTTYNEKKVRDFYKAICHIENEIRTTYPTIDNELIYYLNHSYFYLLLICESIDYYGREREKATAYLKDNWHNSFSLEKMSVREKVMYLLIKLRLFRFAKHIKGKLKRITTKERSNSL